MENQFVPPARSVLLVKMPEGLAFSKQESSTSVLAVTAARPVFILERIAAVLAEDVHAARVYAMHYKGVFARIVFLTQKKAE